MWMLHLCSKLVFEVLDQWCVTGRWLVYFYGVAQSQCPRPRRETATSYRPSYLLL